MAREDTPALSRRQLLASTGALGAAGLAGCGSTTDSEPGEPAEEDVPSPSVGTGDTWNLLTPDSEPRVVQKGSTLTIDYKAVGHTARYDHSALRSRIKEETFGEIDRPFVVAFASRIDIFPDYASLGTVLEDEAITESLKSELKTAMEEFGMENIQDDGTTERPDTSASTWHVLRGDFPVEPVTVDGVDIPHSDRSQLEFGGDSLRVKGVVGRWKSDGSILAAGGVYPDERYADSDTIEMSPAISLDVNIDLGIDPGKLERDLFDFVETVSV